MKYTYLFLTAAMLFCGLAASAADSSWIGDTTLDNLWTNSANWSVEPAATNRIIIGSGTGAVPSFSSADNPVWLHTTANTNILYVVTNWVDEIEYTVVTNTTESAHDFTITNIVAGTQYGTALLINNGGALRITSTDTAPALDTGTTTTDVQVGYGDSDGHLFLADGGILQVRNFRVGVNSSGTLTITNATLTKSGANINYVLGDTSAGNGFIHIQNGGYLNSGTYGGVAGDNGYGEILVDEGGRMGFAYGLTLGNAGSGTGVFHNAGTVAMSRDLNIGNSGFGKLEMTAASGSLSARNIFIGNNESGRGMVTIGAGRTINSSASCTVQVGVSGNGLLDLRGGTLSSSSGSIFYVRTNPGAYGVVRGWGAVSNYREIYNNGLVVADGEGEDRELRMNINRYDGNVRNSITNLPTQTNGWHAVNKGKLTLVLRTERLGLGKPVFNWGEAEGASFDDEDIDLVNSFRVSMVGATANGTFSASLLAPDRDDVATNWPLPEVGECVALWDVSFSQNFESVDFEARYDHTKVKGGQELVFARWVPGENPGEGKWEKLKTYATGAEDAPYRVKTDGVLPHATSVASGRIGLMGLFAYPKYSFIIIK